MVSSDSERSGDCVIVKPNGTLLTASESLCRLRGRVALADIAFTGGGNIVVAATDGSSSSPVQFYKVCVSVVNEKCRIDTELLPSLFMRCTTDPVRRDKYPAVTHLKFLTRENSEQVQFHFFQKNIIDPKLMNGRIYNIIF